MNLDEIMLKYPKTDKSTIHHGYTLVYEKFFHPLWDKPITLFEAGIGGYNYIERGGDDLYAFAEYFPYGKIYAIDIYPKKLKPHPRIETFVCSQTDNKKLEELFRYISQPDIIIDDGSHHAQMTVLTFEILFPKLKDGGIYIVEDAHTAYYDSSEYNGCADKNNKDWIHIHNYVEKHPELKVEYHSENLVIIRK